MLLQNVESNRVSQRFGHLAAVWINPHSMRNDAARLLNSRCHQKRRPVNGMKSKYVFANEMQCRPELLETYSALALFISKTDRCDVIAERIKPNVHRVVRIAWDGNAPAH